MSVELLSADGVRACRNPTAAAAAEPYGPARAEILNDAGFSAAGLTMASWFLLGIALMELGFGPRIWCRSLCPGGAVSLSHSVSVYLQCCVPE